jgi:hypothetical protein
MAILTPQEKDFLDVFIHEATTSPFTGPATKALHALQVRYHDISWISWAYNRECPVDPITCEWGHAAEVAPPLPWPDRATALRRNDEIGRIAEQERQPALAPKAS